MRSKLLAMAMAATTALSPISSSAESLVFGTGNVVIHPINQRIMIPWSEAVNETAAGALELGVL